jgi:hypothetical protein
VGGESMLDLRTPVQHENDDPCRRQGREFLSSIPRRPVTPTRPGSCSTCLPIHHGHRFDRLFLSSTSMPPHSEHPTGTIVERRCSEVSRLTRLSPVPSARMVRRPTVSWGRAVSPRSVGVERHKSARHAGRLLSRTPSLLPHQVRRSKICRLRWGFQRWTEECTQRNWVRSDRRTR